MDPATIVSEVQAEAAHDAVAGVEGAVIAAHVDELAAIEETAEETEETLETLDETWQAKFLLLQSSLNNQQQSLTTLSGQVLNVQTELSNLNLNLSTVLKPSPPATPEPIAEVIPVPIVEPGDVEDLPEVPVKRPARRKMI